MKTHAPFAAAAEQQSKPMITTHLMVTFFAMNATAAKQSPASIAATESGQTTMQAQTVCHSATLATMITTRPANAAVESFIETTPITMMTMTTPITFTDKPVDKPPNPKETDGYYEFRKCSDLVVRAFADSQGIGLRQLAKMCGVSYTTIKYWTSKRNSPSHAQYESVFMDYYLNTYRNDSE